MLGQLLVSFNAQRLWLFNSRAIFHLREIGLFVAWKREIYRVLSVKTWIRHPYCSPRMITENGWMNTCEIMTGRTRNTQWLLNSCGTPGSQSGSWFFLARLYCFTLLKLCVGECFLLSWQQLNINHWSAAECFVRHQRSVLVSQAG